MWYSHKHKFNIGGLLVHGKQWNLRALVPHFKHGAEQFASVLPFSSHMHLESVYSGRTCFEVIWLMSQCLKTYMYCGPVNTWVNTFLGVFTPLWGNSDNTFQWLFNNQPNTCTFKPSNFSKYNEYYHIKLYHDEIFLSEGKVIHKKHF